ncbi:hypothetical protein BEWA_046850 [Theileria equi strain WA]|uniref:Uncharacterized protein n=1 Tax=Theileria equi strain WA TaxID=1537102 RepID=L1L9P4_THEEQ|nr:hypothetical protein BEWA_046850 [Theileria equi strain WA]EKX72221.1 hypothetical protein BEWA_046850 [Theileria equi strain WA]|eukprot:XP_004831673.1 hypothetical protein BEWA_046850 [Theileria equi strain WA]
MTRTHTCIRGRYVDVNISKTGDNGSYQDGCGNSINFTKVDGHPSSGYKKYIHTFGRSYYIGGINYNGEKQLGIPVSLKSYYNKDVTVYYLGYDECNLVPLVVGITKSGNSYEYYKKVTYFVTSNQWTREKTITRDRQLSSKLPEIGRSLTTAIILKIDQTTKSIYYANGTSSPPPANLTTQIQVTESSVHDCYKKYKHTPKEASVMRLLSTKHGGKKIPFEDLSIYTTPYTTAHVYFWEGDSRHRNPLLLGLEQTSGIFSYYILSGGGTDKKWKYESDIDAGNLKDKLDKLNCEKNQAHIIDISRNSSPNKYTCLTKECGASITFANYGANDYSYYLHVLDTSIRRFKDGEKEQTGINSSETSSQVYVYHCPKGRYGIPLLIYFPGSSHWFERTSLNSTKWTEVSPDKPSGYNDNPKILELIKTKLPIVTINVGDTNGFSQSASGSGTTYTDPGTMDNPETISLTKNDVLESEKKAEYTSFVHCVQGKPYFVAKGIKHNGDTLQGIPSNFILKTVTAYYSGKGPELKVDDLSLDDLLLVGFEKKNGPNNYMYYGRKSGGPTWTVIPGKTKKLDGKDLTTQLKKLTDELAKTKEKLTKPSDTESETKLLQGNGFSGGAIAGISVASVGGTGVVGLAVWKGPAIVSYMDFRKDVNLPEIRNVPVSPVLHGDRDDREPTEFKRTIISSAITQDDLDFYEELERKQNLAWKRRLEQDLEYSKEVSRAKQADLNPVDAPSEVTRKKKRETSKSSIFSTDPEIKKVPTVVVKGKKKEANESKEEEKKEKQLANLLEGYLSDD